MKAYTVFPHFKCLKMRWPMDKLSHFCLCKQTRYSVLISDVLVSDKLWSYKERLFFYGRLSMMDIKDYKCPTGSKNMCIISVCSDLAELWLKMSVILVQHAAIGLKYLIIPQELCVTGTAASVHYASDGPSYNGKHPVVFRRQTCTCPFHLIQCLYFMSHAPPTPSLKTDLTDITEVSMWFTCSTRQSLSTVPW